MCDRHLNKERSLIKLGTLYFSQAKVMEFQHFSNQMGLLLELLLRCQVNRCLSEGDRAMKEGHERDECVGRTN